VLAYRLAEQADRLTILEEGISKRYLIDVAKQHWHLPASLVWIDTTIPSVNACMETDTTSYELRSLCWKIFWVEDSRKYSLWLWYTQETLEAEFGDCRWPATISATPFPADSQESPFSCFQNQKINAISCTQYGIVPPDDYLDTVCYTCLFNPHKDWNLPFGWITHGSSLESTSFASIKNADLSYISNQFRAFSTSDASRNSTTAETTPAKINMQSSLSMPWSTINDGGPSATSRETLARGGHDSHLPKCY
jgi:hypothetical protein